LVAGLWTDPYFSLPPLTLDATARDWFRLTV